MNRMSYILSQFTLWTLSLGALFDPHFSPASPQMSPRVRSWIPKEHIMIGEWGSKRFHLSLHKNGKMTLRQSGLILKGQQEELNGSPKAKRQVHKGYWWLNHDQLCLSLQLNAQCLRFKVTGTQDQRVLALKVSQRWFELKRLK